MSEKRVIKIPKGHLNTVIKIFDVDKLKLTKSYYKRVRSKWLEHLNEELIQYRKDDNEIKKEFLPKDENDEIIWTKDENGNEQVEAFFPHWYVEEGLKTTEETNQMLKDLNELANEPSVYEETETNKLIFKGLHGILTKSDFDFENALEEALYDLICEDMNIQLEDMVDDEED